MRLRLERRCPARLSEGEHPNYCGRCELPRGHEGWHVLGLPMEEIVFAFTWESHRKPPPPPPPPSRRD